MSLPDLTRSEYEVLRILWKEDNLTFREVHDQLDNGWAYTTTKTVMDRMAVKGLLRRVKQGGVFRYQSQLTRPQGLAKMVRFFAENVLEVDRNAVVAMFAGNQAMDSTEITELRRLVNQLDDAR